MVGLLFSIPVANINAGTMQQYRTRPLLRNGGRVPPHLQMLALESEIVRTASWQQSRDWVRAIRPTCPPSALLKPRTSPGVGAPVAATSYTMKNANCAVRAAIIL